MAERRPSINTTEYGQFMPLMGRYDEIPPFGEWVCRYCGVIESVHGRECSGAVAPVLDKVKELQRSFEDRGLVNRLIREVGEV